MFQRHKLTSRWDEMGDAEYYLAPDPGGEFVRVSDLIEALEEADLGDFVAAILEMKEPVKP